MNDTTVTEQKTPAKAASTFRALDVNEVRIAGRLGKDAVIRPYGDNLKAANFSVAVNKRYKDSKDQWQSRTSFIDVAAFGAIVKNIGDKLTKGTPVYIEGRLRQDSYKDKEGKNRSSLKIEASKVQLMTKSQEKSAEAGREME